MAAAIDKTAGTIVNRDLRLRLASSPRTSGMSRLRSSNELVGMFVRS